MPVAVQIQITFICIYIYSVFFQNKFRCHAEQRKVVCWRQNSYEPSTPQTSRLCRAFHPFCFLELLEFYRKSSESEPQNRETFETFQQPCHGGSFRHLCIFSISIKTIPNRHFSPLKRSLKKNSPPKKGSLREETHGVVPFFCPCWFFHNPGLSVSSKPSSTVLITSSSASSSAGNNQIKVDQHITVLNLDSAFGFGSRVWGDLFYFWVDTY